MKLDKIKLQGFKGIQIGMGLEVLELDLSQLSGLIALEGDNGMGKTTLLENMQPFRMLPSRKGSLKAHTYLKNSQKDVSFWFNGDHYRCLIKMDPTTTVGDEGFIWKNKEPVVDGKVTNYDKYLFDLMGTPNLFFNSIFAAQYSTKLSELKPAELKSLFAEFLRLDRYKKWEETSKAAVRIYDQEVYGYRKDIERLDTKAKMLGDPKHDKEACTRLLKEITENMEQSRLAKERLTKEIEAKQAEIDEHNRNTGVLEGLQKERKELIGQAEKLQLNMERERNDGAANLATLDEAITLVQKTLDTADEIREADELRTKVNKAIEELDGQIEQIEKSLKATQKSRSTRAASLESLKRQLSMEKDGFNSQIKELTKRMTQVGHQAEEASKKVDRIDDHPELVKLERDIKAMEESAGILDNIDPGCTSEVCGLITNSLENKKALPDKRKLLTTRRGDILDAFNQELAQLKAEESAITATVKDLEEKHAAEVKNLTDKITAQEKDLKTEDDSLETLTDSIDIMKIQRGEYQKQIKTLSELADKLPEIKIAQARKTDLEDQRQKAAKALQAIEDEYTKSMLEIYHKELSVASRIQELEKKVNPDLIGQFNKLKGQLDEENLVYNSLAEEKAKNENTMVAIDRDLLELASLETEIKALMERNDRFNRQISHWSYMAEACSKDGLRALEIEAVAPVICGYANDMLTGAFGPKHSVRFETVDPDGKEILEIVVIASDGSEAMLSNISGGERVWILKAMRLAQTLISQVKSGRHFESALMDEEDGALSNENAKRFISLYRTLMQMAKMDACYYISHRQDAIAMADYRLRLEKGGVKIA